MFKFSSNLHQSPLTVSNFVECRGEGGGLQWCQTSSDFISSLGPVVWANFSINLNLQQLFAGEMIRDTDTGTGRVLSNPLIELSIQSAIIHWRCGQFLPHPRIQYPPLITLNLPRLTISNPLFNIFIQFTF